jgi:hypothetical protein
MAHVAKLLEVSLYREAESLEVYLDTSTLKNRIRNVAVDAVCSTAMSYTMNNGLPNQGGNHRNAMAIDELHHLSCHSCHRL